MEIEEPSALPTPLPGIEEDDEHDSKERVLQRYFLQEWTLVKSLLDVIVSARRVSDLSPVHKIRSIMDKYQEQGQLIEPYLESIVSPLMALVCLRATELGASSDEILEVINPICIIIYSLVTVCGYKSVIKFFPHQVSDLELAVALLEKCQHTNASTSLRQESTGEMETKCIILLWLSILVLIPFDISSVDTSIANGYYGEKDDPPPLVLRILESCKGYLSNAGPMRTIAGLLLSRLLTRPDMLKAFTSFINWAHEIISSVEDNVIDHFRLLGVIEALAAIFKIGSTSVLMNVVPVLWDDTSVLIKSRTAGRSSLLRKYLIKLTQRIGLICLPHRTATWRYVGRNNTLGHNISPNVTSDCAKANLLVNINTYSVSQEESCLEEEVIDVPDIIEDIIELLLLGLRDTDTVVRWSAAKGIGRITSRLTYSLSDEVLSSVLELFSPGEALHYDIRRGPHSVGSHVRDAAAYVCWAFGRAYSHRDMKDVLIQLAPHLLTVACYDREVNCRRAAAAAFQENVGRQGKFPHGIDIVNTADYFALSSRVNSYLYVAIHIAQYDGYLRQFVDVLLQSKICHWDKSLRELAATALSALVKFDPEYFANIILGKLSPCTLSSDLCMRHGAVLATGEVVLALHIYNYILSTDKQRVAADIVPAIEKARLYRGKGGEIMRSAVSRFIECICRAQVYLAEKTKRSLLDTLNENLKHPNFHIQNAAVEALKHYIPHYLVSSEDKGVNDIMSRHLNQLTDPNVAARRGSALALGVLPFEFLAKEWKPVLAKLCFSCRIEDNPDDRDAEARVNSVKGLVSVCETLTEAEKFGGFFSREDGLALFDFIRNEVMSSLFKALDDYSTDNRGDVGSWVREASMDGLERCTYILCKRDSANQEKGIVLELEKSDGSSIERTNPYFDASLANELVGGIVKQAVEKMDTIRESAARILQSILYNKTIFVPNIPLREILEQIVPDEADFKWGVPTVSYPRFVQLLEVGCYSKHVVSGLVISTGGLQESLAKASLSALLGYLQCTVAKGRYESRVLSLSEDILWVLQKYRRCDRVVIPTFKTIETLFREMLLLNMEAQTPVFCAGVLDSLTTELRGTKDFSKLKTGISILGYIASISEPISTRAFSHLLTFLGHRYAKLRKFAADEVLVALQANRNLIGEKKLDEATEIITHTSWDGDVEDAKRRRLHLCELTGLGTPEMVNGRIHSRNVVEGTRASVDENASYSSLVGSAGF
ncbi:hypothetical protein OROHE_004918 [Orobanche hederae]